MDVFANSRHKVRRKGGYLRQALQNGYVEKLTSHDNSPYRVVQRPGLEAFADVGAGPIRGMAYIEGLFNDNAVVVSGPEVYRVHKSGAATLLGRVTNSKENVQISRGRTAFTIVDAGRAYVVTLTDVVRVTDPDLPPVDSVTYINGYTIYAQENSDRFYYTALLDPSNVSALDFQTAERKADPIRCVQADNDEVWTFGTRGAEVFRPTGNQDIAFERLEGVDLPYGVMERNTVMPLGGTLYWVSHENGPVMRANGYSAEPVSDDMVDEHIEALTDAEKRTLYAWGATYIGHAWYALTAPGKWTYVFDVGMGRWYRWNVRGRKDFPMTSHFYAWGKHYFGDARSGRIYELDQDIYQDGGEEIEFVTSFNIKTRRRLTLDSVAVDCVRGTISETEAEPSLMLTYSDDNGRSFETERERWLGLGVAGAFPPVVFRALGLIKNPGRLIELRKTGNCSFSIEKLRVNDRDPL